MYGMAGRLFHRVNHRIPKEVHFHNSGAALMIPTRIERYVCRSLLVVPLAGALIAVKSLVSGPPTNPALVSAAAPSNARNGRSTDGECTETS